MPQATEPKFERWVETAEALSRNSTATVVCPCCGSTSLSVRDVEYGFGHEKGVQRYMTCSCCGAFTGVSVQRAGAKERPIMQAAE